MISFARSIHYSQTHTCVQAPSYILSLILALKGVVTILWSVSRTCSRVCEISAKYFCAYVFSSAGSRWGTTGCSSGRTATTRTPPRPRMVSPPFYLSLSSRQPLHSPRSDCATRSVYCGSHLRLICPSALFGATTPREDYAFALGDKIIAAREIAPVAARQPALQLQSWFVRDWCAARIVQSIIKAGRTSLMHSSNYFWHGACAQKFYDSYYKFAHPYCKTDVKGV